MLESIRIITSISTITLERLDSLTRWLESHSAGRHFTLSPASADASFRRYFRVRYEDESTLIAMDAPPPQENCAPFIKVARMMGDCGLNVPTIVASDLERGFLLLSDLGATTYLKYLTQTATNAAAPDETAPRGTAQKDTVLKDAMADTLFDAATTALVRWQLASRDDTLPPYDEALLRRELELFPQWYVTRHLGVQLDSGQRETLQRMFELIVRDNLAQPSTYVHRDFMPRNLMVSEPNPGILDFQDAVYGPVSYDVVSLFRDAFLSWEEERALDWVVRYWEKARKANLPVRSDFGEFYREFEWMGLQRHLKVLGIFARIRYRDGKPEYLEDAPRFVNYIRAVCERYSALTPLISLFDALEKHSTRPGS